MRILKTDNYVSERVKVKPVTNIEWDKLKCTIPTEIPMSNITSVDDLKEGWLVVTGGEENEVRVAIQHRYANCIFNGDILDGDMFFVACTEPFGRATFLRCDTFKQAFPYSRSKRFYIEKVYKFYIPSLEKICSSKASFKDWYEKQNFDVLLK